jgi:predicted amidohydrolase
MAATPKLPLRIAAAQSRSIAADIAANVRNHCRFITAAHQAGVDLLVFPELSLCGYELPRLRDCLVQADDSRLGPLQDLVHQTGMTVVVGAPLLLCNSLKPAIAALIFSPDASTSVYGKQHLHPCEDHYATPCETGCQCHMLRDTTYALAICADTSHESHAAAATTTGASLYLAGVLVSEAGYAADAAQLAHHARQFNIGVLMANHGGPSGDYVSAGRSAFWAPGGHQVVAAPGTGDWLVIATRDAEQWQGELLAVAS